MDSTNVVLPKKLGTGVNVNPCMQVMECIRPFKLMQQFPSKVSAVRSNSSENLVIQNKNSLNMVPLIPFTTDMGVAQVLEPITPGMFQKLKLKSPAGKDLGEFKVQILPQKPELTQGKTITLPNHGTLTRIDNSSALSLLKATDPNTRRIDVQIATSLSNTTGISIADKNNITGLNQLCISPKNLPLYNIGEHQEGKKKTKIGILRSTKEKAKMKQPQQDKNKLLVIQSPAHSENPPLQIQPNVNLFQLPANHKVLILQADGSTTAVKGNQNFGFAQLKTVTPSISSNTTQNVVTPKPSVENKRTYAECSAATRLNINRSTSYQLDSQDNRPIITVQQNRNGKVVRKRVVKLPDYHKVRIPRLNKKVHEEVSSTTVNRAAQETLTVTLPSDPKTLSKYGRNNNGIKRSDQIPSSSSKINYKEIVIRRESVNGVDPPDVHCGTTSNIEHKKNGSENIVINSNTVDTTVRDNCIPEKNSLHLETVPTLQSNTLSEKRAAVEYINILEENIKEQPESTTIIPEQNKVNENISSNINILKEALGSVTDVHLRAKALKALADCGLKFEREVPIQPSRKTISYGDTDTQTEIFGLIESQQFILASEDSPDLKRISTQIKSIQKSDLGRMSIREKPIDWLNDVDFPTLSDNLPFLPNVEMENILDLNMSSSKINDLFDKPTRYAEGVYKQIKKDFLAATEWDENGMLGIHKAVLNGALHEIERQLVILQGCKMDVDIPTKNGETSLELAVLHDIDPTIVKRLLRAGANPVSSVPAHDSAVAIASKLASEILADLVICVKKPHLLNNFDSQGFAALHYCSQLGFTKGVESLLNAGADVNLCDVRSGRTALFHAIENRHEDLAILLLNRGAISNIPNFARQTVLAISDECKNQTLVEALNKAVK